MSDAKTVTLDTWTPNASFAGIYGATAAMIALRDVEVRAGPGQVIDLPLLVLSSRRVLTIVMMDTMGSGPPHGLIALSDDRR